MGEDKSQKDGGRVVELPRRKARSCPICGRPASERHRPFCSERCADVDLGRWLRGGYRIASEERPRDDEEEGGG